MKLYCFRDKKVFFSDSTKFSWGRSRSQLGDVCVIWRDNAITCLSFYEDEKELCEKLSEYDLAGKKPTQNDAVRSLLKAITSKLLFRQYTSTVKLALCATEFQERVWKELLKVPWGSKTTYQEIAQAIHKPNATRAVGNACGSNPVAILIPCHRVLSRHSKQMNYRWGSWRKLYLLEVETFDR